MRHRVNTVKLSRTSSHRKAMFRNMVTSLFKHDRIRTTDAKAKELRRWADNLITLAKRGDLHARRQVLGIINDKAVVHKLFAEAAERFGDVSGGYTRIIKIGRRPGDAAPVSFIELVSKDAAIPEKKKKKKTAAKEAPAAAPDETKKAVADETEAASDKEDQKGEAASEASEETESSEKDDTQMTETDPAAPAGAIDKADIAVEETPTEPTDDDTDEKEK